MESSASSRRTGAWSRRQVLGALSIAAVALVAACSGAPPAAPTTAPASSAPVSAATPSAASAAAPAASSNAKSAYQGKLAVTGVLIAAQGQDKLNKDFETAHPGVSVQYSYLPSDKFVELFTASQNAGDQIDVLILNGQDLRRYATGSQLVDLTTDVSYKDRFRPIGLKTYSIGGHLWALPYGSIGGFPIFYNKAVLDKQKVAFPATYQDAVEVGKALGKDGTAFLTHSGKNIYLWPVWFFTTYAQVTKNQSVEKTVATLQGQGKFTDAEVVTALDAIFKYSKDSLFIKGVNSLDTDGTTATFLTGKAAAWLQSSGVIKTVRDANPPNFTLDVSLAPQMTDQKVQSQFPGGTGAALCIYKKVADQRRSIAFDFLDFLTQDSNVEWLVRQTKGAVATNTNAKPSDDSVAVKFGGLVENMTIYLDWYWPPEITRAFQENLQAGVGGDKTALEAAKAIQDVFDKLSSGGYKFQG